MKARVQQTPIGSIRTARSFPTLQLQPIRTKLLDTNTSKANNNNVDETRNPRVSWREDTLKEAEEG